LTPDGKKGERRGRTASPISCSEKVGGGKRQYLKIVLLVHKLLSCQKKKRREVMQYFNSGWKGKPRRKSS